MPEAGGSVKSEEVKVYYDEKEDILWFARPGAEEEFRELGDWINIELDENGEPLGIEITGASKLLEDVAESLAARARKSKAITD